MRLKNDKNINYHLSLNNKKTYKLYQYIEWLVENDIQLPKSRISFDVVIPKWLKTKNVSEFLYACLIYVTGETGEGDIQIKEISEE